MLHGTRKAKKPNVVGIIVAIVLVILLVRGFVFDVALIRGRSMLPSLHSGDIVIIFKMAYGIRNPFGGYLTLWQRPRNRDIVVARRPDSGTTVVKRVRYDEGGGQSGDDSLFLLGDNIYESIDSRQFGPVPMTNILGKVLLFPRF